MQFQLKTILKSKFTIKRAAFLPTMLFLLIQLLTINTSAETNKIAYAYGNAIYKMNSDGTAVQPLTFVFGEQRDFSPVWSPDGTKIAFVRVNSDTANNEGSDITNTVTTYNIYTINSDGGNLTQIKSGQSFINDLTWSPDGTKLAYVQGADTTYAGSLQTCAGSSYIYTVNAVANGSANLIAAAVNGLDPSWSPDGTKIFYAVNKNSDYYGIYSVDLADNFVNRLTYDVVPPADPEISPDGSKIAYAVNYAQEQCVAGNMSTMGPTRMYFYTGSLIVYNIAQNSSLVLANGASSPVWHPNGNLILYVSSQSPGSEAGMEQELTTITVNGQNQTLIQNWQSGEISGSWSP